MGYRLDFGALLQYLSLFLQGTAVTVGLTAVAANDDAVPGWTLTSSVTFSAVAGTVYHIAVAGANSNSLGSLTGA